jgi:lambda repressor-like predicted transcriptional regulator
MQRARLEGRRIGRPALDLDREAIIAGRPRGHSMCQIARAHRICRTTVHRVLSQKTPQPEPVPEGVENTAA